VSESDRSDLQDSANALCPGCGYDLRGCPTPICPECGAEYQRADLARIVRRRARIILVAWLLALVVSLFSLVAVVVGSNERGPVELIQALACLVSLAVLVLAFRHRLVVGGMASAGWRALLLLSFVCWGPIGWIVPLILLPVLPVLVPILIATVLWVSRADGQRSSQIRS
jgi:hypothetical protein